MLFIGAMIALVLSGSLLFIFIFWEITAFCSYALISFHNDDPKAVVHYEWTGEIQPQIVISFTSNLRLMWPYSHKVLGELNYGWSDGLNAFVVQDADENFQTFVGFNHIPESYYAGKYDSLDFSNGFFHCLRESL